MLSLPTLAGLASTVIFAASILPMLVKAYRSRDLASYSLGNIALANLGNAVHSVYVYSLPPGPIWLLHTFHLVSSALMLGWYLRYGLRQPAQTAAARMGGSPGAERAAAAHVKPGDEVFGHVLPAPPARAGAIAQRAVRPAREPHRSPSPCGCAPTPPAPSRSSSRPGSGTPCSGASARRRSPGPARPSRPRPDRTSPRVACRWDRGHGSSPRAGRGGETGRDRGHRQPLRSPAGARPGVLLGWVMEHRPSNRQCNSWVVSLLDVHPSDQVLEIGFGPGLAIAELAHRAGGSGHVYGIDHSEVRLRQAARRNAIASQPRRPLATAAASAARTIEALLSGAGYTTTRTETLDLDPPVVCILAINPDPARDPSPPAPDPTS